MATDAWGDLARPPLREAALRRALVAGPVPSWRALEVVDSTGSTNADLAERARDGEPAGLVLLAEHQTGGRGRRDRTWESPARAGLALSVLLRPAVGPDEGSAVGPDEGSAVGPDEGSDDAPDGGLVLPEGGGREIGTDSARVGTDIARERLAWLSLLAGVAVVDALRRTCGLDAGLKWPNDVIVPPATAPAHGSQAPQAPEESEESEESESEDRKIAGVLAEVVPGPGTGSAVILGIGLNCHQDAAELPVPWATSLRLAGSATTDRDTVARAVLRALAVRYAQWSADRGDPRRGVAASYREYCRTLGRPVRVQLPDGSTRQGIAEQVDDAGRLVVRDAAGALHAVSAGDVVHIRGAEPA